MAKKGILDSVNQYYTSKILEHGPTGRGVDWNGEESQILRFVQIAKILPETRFSLLDYGCGYGAFLDYLKASDYNDFHYYGFDISDEMITQARHLQKPSGDFSFGTELQNKIRYDFVVASGLFNVRLDKSDDEWLQYILETLERFDELATKGFSFNILTSYSDKDKQRGHLYYADPLFFFDHCKRRFSRNVALLHDYELYEFTIIVRKQV